MKHFLLLFTLLSLAACQTTFTGFLTGTEYDLCVGLTDDMPAYTEKRNEILGTNEPDTEIADELDCLVNPDKLNTDNSKKGALLPKNSDFTKTLPTKIPNNIEQ